MIREGRSIQPFEAHQENLITEIQTGMERLGLIGRVAGGIQIDINAARKRLPDGNFVDAPLCDHNCRIQTKGENTGHYDCPAARTLHQELSKKTLAPAKLLFEGINRTAQSIRIANRSFLDNKLLVDYYKEFRIPQELQGSIEAMLKNDCVEVNLFGGNPELHPEINEMIQVLQDTGFVVNLTTTGGRFMRDPKFLQRILDNPPDILALSADDFMNGEQINNLAKLSMQEIYTRWKTIPMIYGQQRKTHEAVFVARLAERYGCFPKILFNLVVHKKNLAQIEEIIGAIHDNFPNTIANPYPGQSAFYSGESVFQPEHLTSLENFIDQRITEHIEQIPRIVPRLHYWLMLKAVFETHRHSSKEIARSMSGYDVWKCYETSGANRYIQIGISPYPRSGERIAGGHLACFWNSETVREPNRQVWDMEPNEISKYMVWGMQELAQQIDNPCPGCIMPRLNFDMVSLELGMDTTLVPAYLNLREQHIGF